MVRLVWRTCISIQRHLVLQLQERIKVLTHQFSPDGIPFLLGLVLAVVFGSYAWLCPPNNRE
jgi:hypothetical protein